MIAKRKTHACDTAPNPVARLNDSFRKTGRGGTLVASAGVITLAEGALPDVLNEVRAFADFTADNDPYGEHDFGVLLWRGTRVFWKIDYYDLQLHFASPDPADVSQTHRVLTIMLASEY